jgi:hypothetical protein
MEQEADYPRFGIKDRVSKAVSTALAQPKNLPHLQAFPHLFDSGQGHHSRIRPHPPAFYFINKDGHKSYFGIRGRSPVFVGIRRICWYPCW